MSSENEITQFLSEWSAAEDSGDSAALDRQLTDDFTAVGPLGFMLSKRDWLARFEGGALRYEDFHLEEVRVRQYGDAAVVTAHQSAKASYQGQQVPGHVRDTLVLVDTPQGWRLASIHMSFIAGTPGAPPIPGQPR
jgi:ketosteroid isomerase-like protein